MLARTVVDVCGYLPSDQFGITELQADLMAVLNATAAVCMAREVVLKLVGGNGLEIRSLARASIGNFYTFEEYHAARNTPAMLRDQPDRSSRFTDPSSRRRGLRLHRVPRLDREEYRTDPFRQVENAGQNIRTDVPADFRV
jgi:hypothetical protein